MQHDLKTWPEAFAAVADGSKVHEVRRADRPYAVGDVLRLREWDPASGEYTGQEAWCDVTHVTPGGAWGLPEDLCVMSLARARTGITITLGAGTVVRSEAVPAVEEQMRELLEAIPDEAASRRGIYFASKAKHGSRWVNLREELAQRGLQVTSTWIDECEPGDTEDHADLWCRNVAEASAAAALIHYVEAGERPKGALSEVGAALARGVPVLWVGPSCDYTVSRHPGVTWFPSLVEALARAVELALEAERAESPAGDLTASCVHCQSDPHVPSPCDCSHSPCVHDAVRLAGERDRLKAEIDRLLTPVGGDEAWLLAAEQATVDPDPERDCVRCRATMTALDLGEEPTPLCDLCAHEVSALLGHAFVVVVEHVLGVRAVERAEAAEREVERLRALGPSKAPAGPDESGPANWLVVVLRDGGQAGTMINAYEDEGDAREFFGPASAQWSDSYLCRVVRGPRDGHATPASGEDKALALEVLRRARAWFMGLDDLRDVDAFIADVRRDLGLDGAGETRAAREERKLDGVAAELREALERERGLRAELAVVHAHADDVWFWQGDGRAREDNHPESLTCPVVMRAEILRELLERVEEAEALRTVASDSSEFARRAVASGARQRWVTDDGYTRIPDAMRVELEVGVGRHVWFLRGPQRWEVWREDELEKMLGGERDDLRDLGVGTTVRWHDETSGRQK